MTEQHVVGISINIFLECRLDGYFDHITGYNSLKFTDTSLATLSVTRSSNMCQIERQIYDEAAGNISVMISICKYA
jgi:hypothetical protein